MARSSQSVGTHVARFRQMDAGEIARFLEAWRLMLYWWARRRLGRLPEGIAAETNVPDSLPAEERTAEMTACERAVHRAERYHFMRGNCLLRALTLRDLLRRHGLGAVLRIGVAPGNAVEPDVSGRAAPGLSAHAWVEAGGRQMGYGTIPGSIDQPDYRVMRGSPGG